MGQPFRIAHAQLKRDDAAVADSLAQLSTVLDALIDPASGLYWHAFDEALEQPWADPVTGFNKVFWARAVGWLAMALVDVADLVGEDFAPLRLRTVALIDKIKSLRVVDGLWLQVIDRPDLDGNYQETSASAMFTYALLRGTRLGMTTVPDGLAATVMARALQPSAAGVHAGLVYVPRAPFTVTILGLGYTPADVVLSETIEAEMYGAEYAQRFGAQFRDAPESIAAIFRRISKLSPISTANASVLRIENDGFQMVNLTVRNTYNCDRDQGGDLVMNIHGQYRSGQHQAVALLVAGADRVQVQDVVLRSLQDTLYLQSPRKGATVRSCFTDCEIEGDVDFIFDQSTVWFEGCTIRSLGGRALKTWATAPITDIRTRYGFVFHDCDFITDELDGTRHFLGRQWLEGVRATPFGTPNVTGYSISLGEVSDYLEPSGTISLDTLNSVGKCVILRSRIGAHIDPHQPWDEGSGNHWNSRHRPVLYAASDMLEPLNAWLRDQGLHYEDIAPQTPFLAEFGTVDV